LKKYRASVATYVKVVRMMRPMHRASAESSQSLYDVAYNRLTEAQIAQRVLQQHVAQHQCFSAHDRERRLAASFR
jgi:hypothetical protein